MTRSRAPRRPHPSDPLHIGLYAPSLQRDGSANGIVTYARFMQTALRYLGHRVTLVTPTGIEHADGRIVPVAPDRTTMARVARVAARFGLGGDDIARRGAGIARIISAVHYNDPFDVFEMEESFGWVGSLGLDIPVVARLHGPHFLGKDAHEPEHERAASRSRIAAEGRAIATVDGITCPSPRLLSETLDRYGLIPRHAAAILNPIQLAPAAECWSMERCDPDQILFVGRFDLRKGADIALAAFAIAAIDNPRLRLVLCGPDTGIRAEDATMAHFAEYLGEQIAPALHPRIRYVGVVPPVEIARLRRESGICLSTSRFEVFAYSMTEALAMGVPLIASDTFGMSELLHHGETGWLAPIGNAAAVAATISAALGDHAVLASVGAAGRALCNTALDPLAIAKETVAFYRSIS